jgi:desulfoferrodoxin (superoxide reductase-like protein)
MAAVTALACSGCSLMHDDLPDCDNTIPDVEPTVYKVRFRYDMNMKFADAFAHEVKAVQLMVLDKDMNVVWRGYESGSALAEDGYAITVPVNPGNYQLLAWCSTNERESYTFDFSGRSVQNYTCTLNSSAQPYSAADDPDLEDVDYVVNHRIDDLYHGLVGDVEMPDTPGEHIYWVPLTKDTNHVRVVLQHVNGDPIDEDQFTFKIEDDNAVLNYDNSLIPGHPVMYYPWTSAAATTSDAATAADDTDESTSTSAVTQVNVYEAELTVNRLFAENNPRLTVTNNQTGEVVFSIPVKDYALMVKGYENADMPDQEYLDRQDEYNMTFFLDESDRWFSSYIYINSWRVVLNNNAIY